MANKKYVWVGGATGTSANRFSWHEPVNWLIVEGNFENPNTTGTVPGPFDSVQIGAYERYYGPAGGFRSRVKAPLLWGGFMGGATGGHWGGLSYGFTSGPNTQSITKQGLTGTTFSSSLSQFVVDGTWGLLQDIYGTKTVFNYPYPVIGGGLTGDNIELLKGVSVAGMTFSDWDNLAALCTPEQAELKIKANNVILSGDQLNTEFDKNAHTIWNDYSLDDNWVYPFNDRKNNKRRVYLTLVDNFGITGAGGRSTNIATTVYVDGTGIEAYFKNSKIISFDVGSYIQNILNTDLYAGLARTDIIYPVAVVLDNCQVMDISNTEFPYLLTTYPNCTIGSITTKILSNVVGKNTYNSKVGITWDIEKPLHNLNGVFSLKTATPLLSPGTTSGFDDLNIIYEYGNLKQIIYDYPPFGVRNVEGTTLINCVIQFGDKELSPETGTYPNGATFTAYSGYFQCTPDSASNYPGDARKNPLKIVFGNSGKIETLEIRGAVAYGLPDLTTSDVISMMTCKLNNGGGFDFRRAQQFKNWRFGFINGVTYAGGLVFNDNSNTQVFGQDGLRFLNYGVYGKTINTRSGTIYDATTVAPPIREEA